MNYQLIANVLRGMAQYYPERSSDTTDVVVHGFRVRCRAQRSSIEATARKFEWAASRC